MYDMYALYCITFCCFVLYQIGFAYTHTYIFICIYTSLYRHAHIHACTQTYISLSLCLPLPHFFSCLGYRLRLKSDCFSGVWGLSLTIVAFSDKPDETAFLRNSLLILRALAWRTSTMRKRPSGRGGPERSGATQGISQPQSPCSIATQPQIRNKRLQHTEVST